MAIIFQLLIIKYQQFKQSLRKQNLTNLLNIHLPINNHTLTKYIYLTIFIQQH